MHKGNRPRKTSSQQHTQKKPRTHIPNPTGIRHHKPPKPEHWWRRVFRTPEELQDGIDRYFDGIRYEAAVEREVPVMGRSGKLTKKKFVMKRWDWLEAPTVSGLCLLLGIDRATLLNYENKNPEFFNIVKKAKTIIQEYAEQRTYHPGSAVGGIFNLKCNFNWRDNDDQSAGTYDSLDVVAKMSALADALAIGMEEKK